MREEEYFINELQDQNSLISFRSENVNNENNFKDIFFIFKKDKTNLRRNECLKQKTL